MKISSVVLAVLTIAVVGLAVAYLVMTGSKPQAQATSYPTTITNVAINTSSASTSSITVASTTVQQASAGGGLVLVPVQGSCTVGIQCNTQVATASGGTPAYTFSANALAGAAPFGLAINSNGYLTGTPRNGGGYQFGICVTDAEGEKACGQTVVMIST